MIRILIADDHTLLAESLQYMLQQDDSLEIVGIAANGEKAIKLSEQLKPRLVLMDIKMLECDGLQAAGIIKKSLPQTKVIILTTFEDRMNIITAVITGVDGYILKDVKPQDLVLAIKCVDAGFCVLHEAVGNSLKEELTSLSRKGNSPAQSLLKAEDIRIIQLIGEGKNNKEIAEIMNYSEGTIKNRISRMLETIGAKDRTQIVLYALKNDLI